MNLKLTFIDTFSTNTYDRLQHVIFYLHSLKNSKYATEYEYELVIPTQSYNCLLLFTFTNAFPRGNPVLYKNFVGYYLC